MKRLALAVLCACGDGGGFPDAPPPDAAPPTGAIKVDWTVTDANNMSILCNTIGAVSVTVELHSRDVQNGLTEVFTCSSGTGTSSQELLVGTYDIAFHLVGKNGVNLADAPGQMGVVIAAGQTVTLTPLTFAVDATGTLQLKLDTLRAMGNCAVGATGGNIDQLSITLFNTDTGACAPVTFDIEPSATTYTVDCTTPVLGPCIDKDQTLTVMGVTSGDYQIHIVGQEAGVACWSNNDTFQVPALGATFSETVNLGFATGTTGCQ